MRVSLLGIALLNGMPGHESVSVCRPGCLHGGRRRPEVGKKGPVPILVFDVVALEDGASLVLTPFIVDIQFVVLLHHYTKYQPHNSRRACAARPFADFIPLLNGAFVPDTVGAVGSLNLA